MSSNSTRARKERNVQDRVSESLTEVDKAFIAELKRFSDVSNSTAGEAGGSTNNSPTSPAGNYLARKGDSMLGPLALSPPLDFTIDIDANNTINISPLNDNNQYSSNIQLEDVPTSTTLDIIAGATFDGQILILRTFAPNPITISQGTLANGGNIQTPDSNDVTLGDLQMVVLVFDEALVINENTGGTWRLLNTFGTGGITTDASVATLSLPSSQSAGVVDFNSIRLGTGINPETEDGVFRLSGGIFQLNSSVLIVGTSDTMDAQWQTDTEAAFNNPVLIGRASRSITLDSSPSNLSTAPITTAFVDATSTDVFVRLFTTNIFGGTGTIQTVGTWGQIFSLGGGTNGGGGDVSQWSTFSAVSDVNFATFDGINMDRLLFAEDSTTFSSGSDVGFVRSSAGLVANVPTEQGYFWSANLQSIMSVSQAVTSNNTILDVIAPAIDGAVPNIRTFALDTTPTVGTSISRMQFIAKNNNAENIAYAGLQTDIEGIADGSEEGSLSLIARAGGSFVTFMSMNDTADGKITAFRDIHMDTGRNIELVTNRIYANITSDNTFMKGDASSIGFFIADASSAKGTFGTTTLNLKNDYFLQTQIVELRASGITSASVEGSIWYNSDTDQILGQLSSGVVDLGASGATSNRIVDGDSEVIVTDDGIPADAKIEFILNSSVVGGFTSISFLPTIPIDMTIGLNILNIDNLRFLQESGTIPVAATGFVADSNGLRLNLEESADFFTLTYNSATVIHQWSNTAQSSPNLILSDTLTINDSSTDPTTNGTFSRNGTDVKVLSGGAVRNLSDIGAGGAEGTQDAAIWKTTSATIPINKRVYVSNSKQGEFGTAAANIFINTLFYVPIFIGETVNVVELGFNTAANLNGTVSLLIGIYENRTDGSNYPGAFKIGGALTNTAIGVIDFIQVTLVPTTLTPGLYWIALILTALSIEPFIPFVTHNRSSANTVGFVDLQTGIHINPMFGYIEVGATPGLPINAPTGMDVIVADPIPALFAKFNP